MTAIADVLSAHESHLEKLVREKRWKRLALEQIEADEGNQSDAEVLGVCHRLGRTAPDTGCAKTLLDRVLFCVMWNSVEKSHIGIQTCAQ